MRIGIVTTWFERGAAYVSRQYRDALATEHEVFIYARGGESYARGVPGWDDPSVTWGKRLDVPVPTFIELHDFRRWIEAHRLDLVFFNEQQWWEPVLLCNALGITTGAYVDYYTEETVPLFGCYDFLICNTRRHHGVFGWHPGAHYLPWGTDLRLFAPRGSAPVAPGSVTFFHSAGVSPERKGTDLLLEAFDRLPESARLVVHAQLDLAGRLPRLAPLMERLAAAGRLQVVAETIPAPGAYHLGDIYVYPSRLDGIGLTVAEALACGLPVVATDAPPMNEPLDGGHARVVRVEKEYRRPDGYYWPCSEVSVDDLAAQMASFLEHPAELPRLRREARAYAERHLDWEKNAASLPGLFAKAGKLPAKAQEDAERLARGYEEKRLSPEMRLYRLTPRHFKRVNDFRHFVRARLFGKLLRR